MSAGGDFACFQALPPELRLQIWIQALSVRSVWAAVGSYNNAIHDPSATRLPSHWTFIGPAPYLAGLSCSEARRLLKQSYVKPIRGPHSASATSVGSYWVNLDTTVVYFGESFGAEFVLNSFNTDEVAQFKHVALRWCRYGSLARICQRLATVCPALRTIILRRSVTEEEEEIQHPLRDPLSLEMAAYYATIPGNTGPELEDAQLDATHLRSLLQEYFCNSTPRIHVLAADSTVDLL